MFSLSSIDGISLDDCPRESPLDNHFSLFPAKAGNVLNNVLNSFFMTVDTVLGVGPRSICISILKYYMHAFTLI